LKNENEEAVKLYQDKEYLLAADLFLKVIKKATLCCQKSAAELATAYHNYGRALLVNQQFREAESFLVIAFNLRQSSKSPLLEKTEQALKECRLAILQLPDVSFNIAPVVPSALPTMPLGENANEGNAYKHPVFTNTQTSDIAVTPQPSITNKPRKSFGLN
jgi:hypothetical protein